MNETGASCTMDDHVEHQLKGQECQAYQNKDRAD